MYFWDGDSALKTIQILNYIVYNHFYDTLHAILVGCNTIYRCRQGSDTKVRGGGPQPHTRGNHAVVLHIPSV